MPNNNNLIEDCHKNSVSGNESARSKNLSTGAHSGDETEKALLFEDVVKLVQLLRESGIDEISVRQGDLEITVRERTASLAAPQVASTKAQATPEPVSEHRSDIESLPKQDSVHEVRSPIVGTFYRAPAPGEDAYVEVGDRVREGQTLCIVEAMKLMNEIPADVSGEVVEVLAENTAGVEYDQPLFYLRPEE